VERYDCTGVCERVKRNRAVNEGESRTSSPHPWTSIFLGSARNDGWSVPALIPNRHLDRSEAQWRDMIVSACGYQSSATRPSPQASQGHPPHTPGRSYFSASLEMTSGRFSYCFQSSFLRKQEPACDRLGYIRVPGQARNDDREQALLSRNPTTITRFRTASIRRRESPQKTSLLRP